MFYFIQETDSFTFIKKYGVLFMMFFLFFYRGEILLSCVESYRKRKKVTTHFEQKFPYARQKIIN